MGARPTAPGEPIQDRRLIAVTSTGVLLVFSKEGEGLLGDVAGLSLAGVVEPSSAAAGDKNADTLKEKPSKFDVRTIIRCTMPRGVEARSIVAYGKVGCDALCAPAVPLLCRCCAAAAPANAVDAVHARVVLCVCCTVRCVLFNPIACCVGILRGPLCTVRRDCPHDMLWSCRRVSSPVHADAALLLFRSLPGLRHRRHVWFLLRVREDGRQARAFYSHQDSEAGYAHLFACCRARFRGRNSVVTRALLSALCSGEDTITGMTVSPSDDTLVAFSPQSMLRSFPLSTIDTLEPGRMHFQPLAPRGVHAKNITCTRVFVCACLCACADLREGGCGAVLLRICPYVFAGLDICASQPIIVTCSSDRFIRVWNYITWTCEVAEQLSDEVTWCGGAGTPVRPSSSIWMSLTMHPCTLVCSPFQ